MKKAHICFTAALCLAAPGLALANGTRISDHNPTATARGNAFVATADNPSAIAYNPAGLTQLSGVQALISGYTITLESRVQPVAGPNFDSKYTTATVPSLFLSWKPEQTPLAVGLGVYTPFGLGIEYDDNVPFRTVAIKGHLSHTTINPVVAWQVAPQLSIAAGAMINVSTAELAQGVFLPDDEFRFEGDGVSYGFNLGLMWQPSEKHSFGARYQSQTNVKYKGDAHLKLQSFTVPTPFGPFKVPGSKSHQSATMELDFPQSVAFGYSFRPTPDWNIEIAAEWLDWDTLGVVTLRQKDGTATDIPFNWKSSWFYEIGVTRKLPAGFALSAGYIYSENSVPEGSFNPLVPDADKHIFSIGLSQKLERLSWDIAYQFTWGPERTIDTGTSVDGKYEFFSHAINLSLGYNF